MTPTDRCPACGAEHTDGRGPRSSIQMGVQGSTLHAAATLIDVSPATVNLRPLSRLARLAGIAGGGLLGLVVLVWVVEHCGATTGEVIVHVMESDVELSIGGEIYRIQGRSFDPIVCELPAGRHELVLRRGDQLLYRESFDLPRGASVVRTAWDPRKRRAGSEAPPGVRPAPHGPAAGPQALIDAAREEVSEARSERATGTLEAGSYRSAPKIGQNPEFWIPSRHPVD